MTSQETENLINEHYGLIVSIAKRYTSHQSYMMDDLIQEGKLAIWQYGDRYDKEKGEISTWLYRAITWRILKYLDTKKRYNVRIQNIPLTNFRASTEYFDIQDFLPQKISQRERDIFHMYYIDRYKVPEIAKRFDISIKTCYNSINNIKAIIKEQI